MGLQAMRCPHGNHVLQKCIKTMQPESLQFIIDEITQEKGLVVQAAKHRYACRIIQHLLAACPVSQVSRIAASLQEEVSVLACHKYGTYAAQHLMMFGSSEHQYQLVRYVEQNATSICRSHEGCRFLLTAIKYAASEDSVWIARAVAQDPEIMLILSRRKLGWKRVLPKLVLETLPVEERERAGLTQLLEDLRASRYGAKLAQRLDEGQ